MIKDIVLATHNPHKLQEFSDYLAPLGIRVHSEKEFVNGIEVEETGLTYQENAFLKANAIKPFSPYPVLADDSGIEISALGEHFPGIRSARFLESLDRNSLEADKKLLAMLDGKSDRSACFHCVLALLEGEDVKYFEGECPGEILFAITGEQGFGYDPIFRSKEGGANFGEIDEMTKGKYSHRGKAVKKLLDYLKERNDR